jgi:hypothetical protein
MSMRDYLRAGIPRSSAQKSGLQGCVVMQILSSSSYLMPMGFVGRRKSVENSDQAEQLSFSERPLRWSFYFNPSDVALNAGE